ncbi:MAG: F0F1 ATP synthase subunit epsilon [Actinobacteria bacterium]|nr:F0F1 ATP synthase subunit epsilon [Actinomycetota bacterium]
MATFHVEVVSAERSLWSGEASEVYARSLDGEIGILPGHQPALLALDIAPVKIKQEDGTVTRVAVHRGFLYFRPDTGLIVLADMADLSTDVDLTAEEARVRELEQRLGREDDRESRDELRRAETRVSVARE